MPTVKSTFTIIYLTAIQALPIGSFFTWILALYMYRLSEFKNEITTFFEILCWSYPLFVVITASTSWILYRKKKMLAAIAFNTLLLLPVLYFNYVAIILVIR